MLKTLYRKHRELLLYGVIGTSGALLDLLCFLALTSWFNWHPVAATALSVSVGIINNFIWNALVNFKTRDRMLFRFISFYTVGLIGVALSMLLMYLLHDVAGMDALPAKLLSIPVVVIGQFIANKTITFARTPNEEPETSP